MDTQHAGKKAEIIWRQLIAENPGTEDSVGNEPLSKDDFKATNGWVVHFMNRHGLSLRKRTSLAQHDPSNLVNQVISFILSLW